MIDKSVLLKERLLDTLKFISHEHFTLDEHGIVLKLGLLSPALDNLIDLLSIGHLLKNFVDCFLLASSHSA